MINTLADRELEVLLLIGRRSFSLPAPSLQ